jgi:hypothetical protein
MAKWVKFTDERPSMSGKTKGWHVRTIGGGVLLGYVFWRAPWRKYVFAPIADTIYEQDCLRDIAEFIETQTKEHKRR